MIHFGIPDAASVICNSVVAVFLKTSEALPPQENCMSIDHPSPENQLATNAFQGFFLAARESQGLGRIMATNRRGRRDNIRVPRSISVSIQPLDDDFRADGGVFWVVSRDISVKGLGLISYDPIYHEFVRVGLVDEGVSVIGRIRHNTSIGHDFPLFLVGVEFIIESNL